MALKYPYFLNSCCRSKIASPNLSTGKAISSKITVVPLALTAPTAGNMPLRTFHKRACFAASRVNSGSVSNKRSLALCRNRFCFTSTSSMLVAWNSTSKAAACAGNDFIICGRPGMCSTERSEALSINSIASAPAFVKGTIAWQASYISLKYKRAVDFAG